MSTALLTSSERAIGREQLVQTSKGLIVGHFGASTVARHQRCLHLIGFWDLENGSAL
jgi:hypothetical protein